MKNIKVGVEQGVLMATVGIILGILINKIFEKITPKKHKLGRIFVAHLQVVFNVLTILLIYRYLPEEFTWHFQNTSVGMLFPAFFFGVQLNMLQTFMDI